MGSCFSNGSHRHHSSSPSPNQYFNSSANAQPHRKEAYHQSHNLNAVKRKEVFVIMHRRSLHNAHRIPHSSPLARTNDNAVPIQRSHSATKLGTTDADRGREMQAAESSRRRRSVSPATRMDCNLIVKTMTPPAVHTTSSSSMEASSTVTRISVKRIAGKGSPRSLSPSEGNGSLNSYRKTSPHRRAPLSRKEIPEVTKGGHEKDRRGVNNSYTNLLLQDIENFHQKSASLFKSPAGVTKARSIVGAVADLNSATRCDAKKENRERDMFVESEVEVLDDLMDPSFHKYVTCRRRSARDDEESSGSNGIGGGAAATSGDRRIQSAKIPAKVRCGNEDRITVGKDAKIESRHVEAVAIL